jgi:hypothetical protein
LLRVVFVPSNAHHYGVKQTFNGAAGLRGKQLAGCFTRRRHGSREPKFLAHESHFHPCSE